MMIDSSSNDTFSFWREEGNRQIPQNFKVFRSLVAQAKDFTEQGKYDSAAVYAAVASEYAFSQHCGIFASPELEEVLLTIGRRVIKDSCYPSQNSSLPGNPKRILHVTDAVRGIGGHSRMVWRWIKQDIERSHSVVLTEQSVADVHKELRNAVLNSHGAIYALNETIGSFVSQAKRLSKIASSFDVVVLHTMRDIVPLIAFANKEQSPPVIFVNHADERIWLGVGISDLVANLRETGMRLSQKRRGVEEERNALLPIILDPIYRSLSRAEAKQKLGLANESIVILSIARSHKYKTIDGGSFADVHISLLKQHEQAILLVVGPGDNEDWSAAIQQTQGRIRVLGQTEETSIFYEAADIYVDSFPWISNTSLLEAGSYGLPLVSRYPYSSDECEVIGADMPGLTDNLIRVDNLDEYTAKLSHLIKDKDFRLSLGEATRSKIVDTHIGSNWQRSLEELYSRAATINRITVSSNAQDQMFLGELDLFLPTVVLRQDYLDLDQLLVSRVRLMPLEKRFEIWLKQIEMGDFGQMGHLSFLLPQWLYLFLQKYLF